MCVCERDKENERLPGEGVGLTGTGASLLGVCENEDNTGGSFHPWMLVLRASKATFPLPPLGGSLQLDNVNGQNSLLKKKKKAFNANGLALSFKL